MNVMNDEKNDRKGSRDFVSHIAVASQKQGAKDKKNEWNGAEKQDKQK